MEEQLEFSTANNAPPPFLVRLPKIISSPFLFCTPHSGRYYPVGFRQQSPLGARELRLSEDAFVDELFEGVVQTGATELIATHARAFVDLNRAPNELEPDMFSGEHGAYEVDLNNRVKAGLGVIPRIIGEGMPIYDRKIPIREAFKRLDDVYHPYHNEVSGLLMARHRKYGSSVLIDCHSMPSGPELGRRRQSQPDIVLGDCWGTSCSRELTGLAERLLLEAGFRVRRNIPYAGGFATRHYGAPSRGCHALQIEINRSLYMDERRVEKLPHFDEVGQRLRGFSKELLGNYDTLPKDAVAKDTVAKAAE